MKLFNNLHNIIVEHSTPWYEKVFQSEDAESLWPITKMFGGDLHEIYKALEGMGKEEDFLKHIFYHWPGEDGVLRHIIHALGGMKDWNNGTMDNDMLDKYVIDPYLEDMRYIDWEKRENHRKASDRIILELMPGEEAEFFSGYGGRSYDCDELAKQIFSEEGLEWEPYDVNEKLEDLIKVLSPENYIKLVRHIGIEFQNEEVDAWREEFDNVREDNGKVIITPEFMNAYLPGDEGDRYNLAVLIGNTPELDEVEGELNNAYSSAWNHVVWDQYYQEYNDAFHDFLGKPIGHGTTYTYPKHGTDASSSQYKKVEVPVEYFDVTELIMPLIVRHVEEIDNPENFLTMLNEFDMDTLCPNVQDYPYNTEDVNNLFQEYLWDYL